jgi:hypothetical protein
MSELLTEEKGKAFETIVKAITRNKWGAAFLACLIAIWFLWSHIRTLDEKIDILNADKTKMAKDCGNEKMELLKSFDKKLNDILDSSNNKK